MTRILLGSVVAAAVLSTGCINNGEVQGTLALKCYYDQQNTMTNDEGDTVTYWSRHVFNEMAIDLATGEGTFEGAAVSGNVDVVGRVNEENEFQLTAIWECEENCRMVCGAPPVEGDNVEVGGEFDSLDIDRIVTHVVAGREEQAGVASTDWPLYSPAYFIARGFTYDQGGACVTGEAEETLFDVAGNAYGDPMAFSIVQVNVETSGLYALDSGNSKVPIAEGDTECQHVPWAQVTVDDSTQVVKRGDATGNFQISNMELLNQGVLVDVYGPSGPFSAATFTTSGLYANNTLMETVVTTRNDAYELGL